MSSIQGDPNSYRTIDGFHYRCRKLPALKGLQLTTELARHLGSPLVTLIAGASDGRADLWTIAQYILREGLDNLYPEAAAGLMIRMMESVYTDASSESNLGTEQRFNAHFDSRPNGILTAMEVWVWALEVNFKSFFDAARSRLSPAQPAAEPGAQNTSNA